MKGTVIRFKTAEERRKKSNEGMMLNTLQRDTPLKYYSRLSSLIHYDLNGDYCIQFNCRDWGDLTWDEFIAKAHTDLQFRNNHK